MPPRPWSIGAAGVDVTVRLTPRAGQDAIDGIDMRDDGRPVLKVRLRAAPREGEANAALMRFLARAVGVAPRRVILIAGATARIKRLRIEGDGRTIAAALEKIAAIG